MKHLSDTQLLRLADRFLADEPCDPDTDEALTHIRGCKSCFDAFCSACALLHAVDPFGSLRLDEESLQTLDKETGLVLNRPDCLAVFRVGVQKAAGKTVAFMEQLKDSLGTWVFAPPMAMAGARSAGDDTDNPAVSSLESPDSRYSYIRFDAERGELRIQIDPEDIPTVPEHVVLRYPDGAEQELQFTAEGRFLTIDAHSISSFEFELLVF